MKKSYIKPEVIEINSNLNQSLCTASINNGGEFTPGKDIPDESGSFDVGAKGSSWGLWDDDEEY